MAKSIDDKEGDKLVIDKNDFFNLQKNDSLREIIELIIEEEENGLLEKAGFKRGDIHPVVTEEIFTKYCDLMDKGEYSYMIMTKFGKEWGEEVCDAIRDRDTYKVLRILYPQK